MSDQTPMTPTTIAGKVLFESGVTIKNAERMIDLNRRTAQNRGIDNSDLIAYFQYEVDSLKLYRELAASQGLARRDCAVCQEKSHVIEIPAFTPKCLNCGAWY